MKTNDKVTTKELLPKSGQLIEGLTASLMTKVKMELVAIDIFELEPMELAKWWVVEIEKNGGIGKKAEILSLDDQGNAGAINTNTEVREKGTLQVGRPWLYLIKLSIIKFQSYRSYYDYAQSHDFMQKKIQQEEMTCL